MDMTTDIDGALRRLAARDHPGLCAIDETVMARIHERQRSKTAFGAPLIALAVFGATALGTTAGSFPLVPRPTDSLSPFTASNPLALSTLLDSDN